MQPAGLSGKKPGIYGMTDVLGLKRNKFFSILFCINPMESFEEATRRSSIALMFAFRDKRRFLEHPESTHIREHFYNGFVILTGLRNEVEDCCRIFSSHRFLMEASS